MMGVLKMPKTNVTCYSNDVFCSPTWQNSSSRKEGKQARDLNINHNSRAVVKISATSGMINSRHIVISFKSKFIRRITGDGSLLKYCVQV